MNALQIFKSHEFGEIRTTIQNGEPWFVAADVCKALDIENNRKATNRLDDDEKSDVTLSDGSQMRHMTAVNEAGLYSLVLGSRKPEAKAFKRWITHEVLPSIRKTGGYITGQEGLSDTELLEKAVLVAQRRIAERDKQIERMKPAQIFADAVCASEQSILVGDLAKLLRQNGIDIGQKRLFEWLRSRSYLIKRKGSDWNMPTQRSMDMELFEIKETAITHSDGHVTISRTVKVTGKGQKYFINKFLDRLHEEEVQ